MTPSYSYNTINHSLNPTGDKSIFFSTSFAKFSASRVTDLNAKYPPAALDGRVSLTLLPLVQAPFKVYWAYNPNLVGEYLQPPIVADRAMSPNNATFLNAITEFGQEYPFFEKHSTFRFTIGRTF